ncbi:DUF2301 domain-containing membrane protein [Vibrio hepatarius]|uniref:DUF2301 domain-containing membrane protein n=1 Tax=Vibrio hepatarius TaxID=171383 RepID=UPI0037366BD5
MADPHIKSPMDALDHLTVIVYRLGFTLAFPVIALLPWNLGFPIEKLVFLSAVMCASSLHVYSKPFRLLLQFATWIGILCFVSGWTAIGIGGAFITLGGLCYKEYFCFKVPGLQLQPLILMGLWFCMMFDADVAAKILGAISALLFLVTSVYKWRMPRYFDIGDKAKYDV